MRHPSHGCFSDLFFSAAALFFRRDPSIRILASGRTGRNSSIVFPPMLQTCPESSKIYHQPCPQSRLFHFIYVHNENRHIAR
ncbi:MAG: hypothetical protein BGO99_01680 [Nitrosospira sp. 56-18]|nr:MAG: hypothetical protein BGO99_01680 [Nitrosospira sp. 56-18]